MTKKRLSDLVREEVQREADQPSGVEAAAEPASPSEKAETTEQSAAKMSRLNKAQLEEKITGLTAALMASQQQEGSLKVQVEKLEAELQSEKDRVKTLAEKQAEISQLEAALEEQRNLVKKLYAELQQAKSLASELEEQKQLVQQLYAELEEVRQAAKKSSVPHDSQKLVRQGKSTSPLETRPIARFSIPPQPSPKISNEDIGWFD